MMNLYLTLSEILDQVFLLVVADSTVGVDTLRKSMSDPTSESESELDVSNFLDGIRTSSSSESSPNVSPHPF